MEKKYTEEDMKRREEIKYREGWEDHAFAVENLLSKIKSKEKKK